MRAWTQHACLGAAAAVLIADSAAGAPAFQAFVETVIGPVRLELGGGLGFGVRVLPGVRVALGVAW